MKATEILRGILDIIDDIEDHQTNDSTPLDTAEMHDDEARRMNQIKDLLPTADVTVMYANSPAEATAEINAVTTDAGGGVNGPKHSRDLRGNSFPIYPEE